MLMIDHRNRVRKTDVLLLLLLLPVLHVYFQNVLECLNAVNCETSGNATTARNYGEMDERDDRR